MLLAIAACYNNTQLALGLAVITATAGVRQGSPTSCFLFTCYVNPLIRAFKALCQPDGFLQKLHCLMLMDDTVIFATSREQCERKFDILMDFCQESGMVLNDGKTKFMVFNGEQQDMNEITRGDIKVKVCDKYVYLGATFTGDGRLDTSVKRHAHVKYCHVLKFLAFVKQQCDFPFWSKKLVFDAALLSAVFYSCESWMADSVFKHVQPMYHSAVKALLGVRTTTANYLCLAEVGLPTVKGYIQDLQAKYFTKILAQRENLVDDPFMFAWVICREKRTPHYVYVSRLLAASCTRENDIAKVKCSIANDNIHSKFRVYKEINPDMSVHPVYGHSKTVPEHQRLCFSRLRLSSHNLRIETGRWSRTPREQRLCACGEVQTEEHIICKCHLTNDIREKAIENNVDFSNVSSFFASNTIVVCKVLYDMYNCFM